MTEQTSAVARYCACCGREIDWRESTWVMNRAGRLEYYHVGCDLPPGYAVVDGEAGDDKCST